MNLQRVAPVLQRVIVPFAWRRKLARFTHRNKSRIQAVCQRRGKNKAARLHPQHQIDILRDVMLGKFVDERGESGFIFQQCGDVVKENPLLGKIGNLANELLQMIGVQGRGFRHLPRSFENKISQLQLRNLPGPFDPEGTQALRRSGLRNFNGIDAGCPRPLPQAAVQTAQLIASSLGQHFHAAIVIVAHPARNAEHVRFPLHKPAEPDPLHAPAHDVPLRFNSFFAGNHFESVSGSQQKFCLEF